MPAQDEDFRETILRHVEELRGEVSRMRDRAHARQLKYRAMVLRGDAAILAPDAVAVIDAFLSEAAQAIARQWGRAAWDEPESIDPATTPIGALLKEFDAVDAAEAASRLANHLAHLVSQFEGETRRLQAKLAEAREALLQARAMGTTTLLELRRLQSDEWLAAAAQAIAAARAAASVEDILAILRQHRGGNGRRG
jgi:predicted metallopeptidase